MKVKTIEDHEVLRINFIERNQSIYEMETSIKPNINEAMITISIITKKDIKKAITNLIK